MYGRCETATHPQIGYDLGMLKTRVNQGVCSIVQFQTKHKLGLPEYGQRLCQAKNALPRTKMAP